MARGKKPIKQTLVSCLVSYLGVCPPFFNPNPILTCTRPALFDIPFLLPSRTRPIAFTIAFVLLTNSPTQFVLEKKKRHTTKLRMELRLALLVSPHFEKPHLQSLLVKIY
jgi:hypothetical protein